MIFREHVADMCLPAPASTCMDLHTERHMKDTAAQTNNGQMSHWMRDAPVRESLGRNQTPIWTPYWCLLKGGRNAKNVCRLSLSWMKSAHKTRPRQPSQFLFQEMDAGNPHLKWDKISIAYMEHHTRLDYVLTYAVEMCCRPHVRAPLESLDIKALAVLYKAQLLPLTLLVYHFWFRLKYLNSCLMYCREML